MSEETNWEINFIQKYGETEAQESQSHEKKQKVVIYSDFSKEIVLDKLDNTINDLRLERADNILSYNFLTCTPSYKIFICENIELLNKYYLQKMFKNLFTKIILRKEKVVFTEKLNILQKFDFLSQGQIVPKEEHGFYIGLGYSSIIRDNKVEYVPVVRINPPINMHSFRSIPKHVDEIFFSFIGCKLIIEEEIKKTIERHKDIFIDSVRRTGKSCFFQMTGREEDIAAVYGAVLILKNMFKDFGFKLFMKNLSSALPEGFILFDSGYFEILNPIDLSPRIINYFLENIGKYHAESLKIKLYIWSSSHHPDTKCINPFYGIWEFEYHIYREINVSALQQFFYFLLPFYPKYALYMWGYRRLFSLDSLKKEKFKNINKNLTILLGFMLSNTEYIEIKDRFREKTFDREWPAILSGYLRSFSKLISLVKTPEDKESGYFYRRYKEILEPTMSGVLEGPVINKPIREKRDLDRILSEFIIEKQKKEKSMLFPLPIFLTMKKIKIEETFGCMLTFSIFTSLFFIYKYNLMLNKTERGFFECFGRLSNIQRYLSLYIPQLHFINLFSCAQDVLKERD